MLISSKPQISTGNLTESPATSSATSTGHETNSPATSPATLTESSNGSSEEESNISSSMLQSISQMLMAEDLDEKNSVFDDCLALQAAEKSFYDVIGKKYPLQSHRSVESDHSCGLADTKKDELDNGSKVRKSHREEEYYGEEQERSSKQAAIYGKEDIDDQLEMFDNLLLTKRGSEPDLRGKSESNADVEHAKGQRSKSDGLDLNTILMNCAQAVARNDLKEAKVKLMEIRQQSSPSGSSAQRLAHYFANGLQARISGTGGKSYKVLAGNSSAAEILKACKQFLTACPFKNVSNSYAALIVAEVAKNATSLHIIDFGLLHGYHLPCIIERLATRPGGPPKLRITGIDLPQYGFRPAERIEETGRLLAKYCERFNVPFEYTAIAKKWETVRVEDLKIGKDELTVVNCFYRLKVVPDEITGEKCARDQVLELIRKINPSVFIHGVTNGCYNMPFFLTRFREALYHFSCVFDMYEATMSLSDEKERILCEKETLGSGIVNVIACEGLERVDRPETYKRLEARSVRAGLRLLPLKEGIVERVRANLKSHYHKDFMVDQDAGWLLQGWKGRVLYALSCWKRA